MLDLEDTIAVNPYLLVTTALSTFNEHLLKKLYEGIQQCNRQLVDSDSQRELEPLLEQSQVIEHRLQKHYIPNIFNYSNEQQVCETLAHAKGIDTLRTYIEQSQQSFAFGVQQLQERISTHHQRRTEILLALVGIAQVTRAHAFARTIHLLE